MSLIEVKNLSRIYQQGDSEIKAVDNVTFNIEQGEFTALTGPSGSGKTTLLNLIGALDHPDSGEIIIDNTAVHNLPPSAAGDFRLHHIGFIFQAYNLVPVLTALENIVYVLMLRRVDPVEREERAMELLRQMDMEDLAHRFPREMSGGQQQRVAVARALVADPRLVLADEPTANLDSRNTENLLEIMFRMAEKKHITFLFSTHDARVLKHARRILGLEDGAILTDEQP